MSFLKYILFLFISTDIFPQGIWTLQNSPVTTELDGISSINGRVCWMCGPLNTVIKTTNGGTLWIIANNGISGNFYDMFATDVNHAWVGSDDGRIWSTVNGGNNWYYSIPIPSTPFIDAIHMFDNNTGVAIGDPPLNAVQWRFYFTTNGGLNWNLCPGAPAIDSETGWSNSIYAIDTGHIWWGTNHSKIYRGSMRGPCTGIPVNAQNQFGLAFQDVNTGVALGIDSTPPSIQSNNLRTQNGGTSWLTSSFIPGSIAYGISTAPGISSAFYWIAATDSIYRSTDNGITFASQINLTSAAYCISMVNVDTGWVGGANGKIYRYISNDPIGIVKNTETIPKNYSLSQNYPNPFNPTTTIRFSVPLTDFVNITVYDILGNKVATPVNTRMLAGSYQVDFKASNISSGVYFYTITAGQFKDSKKMILAK